MNTISKSSNGFMGLRNIKYKGNFNPKDNIEHAKAVLALKKSDAFKDFFEKYDVVAEFETAKDFATGKNWAILFLKYRNISDAQKNKFKQLFSNLKNFFAGYNNQIEISATDSGNGSAVYKLIKDINKLTLKDLDKN